MRTTSEYGNAEVKDESYPNIRNVLNKFDGMIVPVVTGFIGHDPKGKITTLGRGGSDLTATVVGIIIIIIIIIIIAVMNNISPVTCLHEDVIVTFNFYFHL